MNDNPYATPVDTQKGKYAMFTFSRFVKAALVVCVTLSILDALILYKGNLSSSQFSPVEILASQFQQEQFRRNRDWWPSTSALP